jgi:hypothetical protein
MELSPGFSHTPSSHEQWKLLFIFFILFKSAELTIAVCHIRMEPYNVLAISHARLFKACSNPLHSVMDHKFHCVASKVVFYPRTDDKPSYLLSRN